MKRSIYITGSTGFLGEQLVRDLIDSPQFLDRKLTLVQRGSTDFEGVELQRVSDFRNNLDFPTAFDEGGILVHIAALAHNKHLELHEYEEVNVGATLKLAKHAIQSGIKRLIFISSAGVHGNTTNSPVSETDAVNPYDYYSVSKLRAEIELSNIIEKSGVELVVIRVPLIYGENAKGSFEKLLRVASSPLPLPFGVINNKRSMIYVKNLTSLIEKCIDFPDELNETFLASDGEDCSLEQLIRMVRSGLGKKARLIAVPISIFRLAAKITGRERFLASIIGDFQVDASKAFNHLAWTPPYQLEQAINELTCNYKDKL